MPRGWGRSQAGVVMKVLLVLLLVLTGGLLVWALLPADRGAGTATGAGAPTAPAAVIDPATSARDRAAPVAPDPAAPDRAAPDRAAPEPAAAPIVTAPATPTAADRPTPPGLDLRAPAQPLPVGEIRLDNPAHGRAADMPMPQAEPAAVKDTLRRYYGNLPRSGRMPDRITVEEILSPALIAALGVPRESQVVEIGHHPATSPQGFEDILAQPDEHETTLGITVVTPDGQRVRDYIRLVPPAPQ